MMLVPHLCSHLSCVSDTGGLDDACPALLLGSDSEDSVSAHDGDESSSDAESSSVSGEDVHDMATRRCGMPFRVDMMKERSPIAMTVNVTSWRQQFDEVLRLPWDLACLQEVRLTAAGQYDMHESLKSDACSVVFGEPQESIANPWHCKQGGVAIVARNGMVLQRTQPTSDIELELSATRRFAHAAVSIGTGKEVLHVMCFYGISGASSCSQKMAHNEALLSQVFAVCAVLGNVPVLLLGDFNVNPEKSSALQRAIDGARWSDACHLCATAQGGSPDPTCFVRATSAGTRIDAIYANSIARSLLGEAGMILDSALQTHCPVCSSGLATASEKH